MRLPLLLTFSLLSTYASRAQSTPPDFIVTTAGDTLRGEVRQIGKHFSKVRLYRPGQAPVQFSAAEATSFGSIRGVESVSRTVAPQGQPQFVKPLVVGPVSLFTGENAQQDKRYYLQIPDSTYLIEVAPVTSQLTLARNLAGCQAFEFGTNAFQRQYPYSNAGLSALVMTYNRCQQPQLLSRIVKHSTGIQFFAGVKAGLNMSRGVVLPDVFTAGPRKNVGVQGGFMVNVATRTPLSVQVEALYVALRSENGPAEATTYNSGIPTNTVSATLQLDQVQVPLLLRYTLGHNTIRPFFNAGFVFSNNIRNRSAIHFPNSPTTADVPISIARTSLGFAGGGGLTIYRAWRPFLTFEIRYDQLEPNYNSTALGIEAGSQKLLHFDAGFYL